MRTWCSCEYCDTKRRGTYYIAHNTFYSYGATSYQGVVYSPRRELRDGYDYAKAYDSFVHQGFEDYIRSGIERERGRKRQKLRAELKEIKEKVL